MSGKIITWTICVERPFYNVECPKGTFLQRNPLLFKGLRGNPDVPQPWMKKVED